MPYSWPIFCVCHTEVINRKKTGSQNFYQFFWIVFFFVCRWADVFVVFFYRSSRGNTCWLRSQSTLNGMLMIDNNFVFSSLWSAIASYNLHRFLYAWYTSTSTRCLLFCFEFFLPHMAIKIKTERRIAYGTCISQTYSDFQIYWWSRHLNTRWSLLLLQAFGSWYIQHHKQTLNRFTTWQMIKICTHKKKSKIRTKEVNSRF